jgi:hypothetical protein
MLTSSMIDAEIVWHLESFGTVWLLSAASRALQDFLCVSDEPKEANGQVREAADGIKPGVERSATPGAATRKDSKARGADR